MSPSSDLDGWHQSDWCGTRATNAWWCSLVVHTHHTCSCNGLHVCSCSFCICFLSFVCWSIDPFRSEYDSFPEWSIWPRSFLEACPLDYVCITMRVTGDGTTTCGTVRPYPCWMTVNHFDVVTANFLVPTIQYCHVVVLFLLLFRWTVVSNWCLGLDCCTV